MDVPGGRGEGLSELKRSAAAGTGWLAASTAFNTAVQLAQLVVLGRLLSPEDFGLMAMILVVVFFAQAFADVGVSNAIVQRAEVTREQLSSLYWLTFVAGAACFAGLVLLRPWIVRLYDEPRLAPLVAWTAASFLVVPLGQQFQLLLQRELRFRELSWIESAATAAGAAAAIGLAWGGHGVWSLVWGQLALAGIRSALLAAAGWRRWTPMARFRAADLRGFVGFGLYQVGERAINLVNQRVDQLLIGTLAGAQALGHYNMAYSLVMQPATRVNAVLTRVAFPVFSRVQDDRRALGRGFTAVRRVAVACNAPVILGLAAVAPLALPNVLGAQWEPAVRLLQVLAGVALVRAAGNPVGSLLLSRGRPDLGFAWNAMIFATQVPAVVVGARMAGALGVALATLALHVVYACVEYPLLVRRLLGPCLAPYVKSVVPSLAAGAAMVLVVAGIGAGVAAPWPSLLALQILAGAAVYVGVYGLLFRGSAREMLQLARGGAV